MEREEEIQMWMGVLEGVPRESIAEIVDQVSPRKMEKKRPRYRVVPIRCYADYLDYLQSEEWSLVKARVWCRDKGECRNCGSAEHLQVHHMSYRYVGREWKDDFLTVILLCRWCHEGMHRKR